MRDTRAAILDFWFKEATPAQWFQKNAAFDDIIKARFGPDHDLGAAGIFDGWMEEGEGSLALIILLDQFPRNMFRDSPRAFATDSKALLVARNAIEKHFDKIMPPIKRRFMYLPFEHSENPSDQDQSVALFSSLKKDDPLGYDYALRHREVIKKFGRFPHRNMAMGRPSTAEEIAYLQTPGSGF